MKVPSGDGHMPHEEMTKKRVWKCLVVMVMFGPQVQ